ncbi:hypothetical protein [Paenibacillus sp. NEAU-GSW1]|uniref:hypothetical protein n=1 Tax=Paenibacillus sp. NEAU-GSW1 TaxID=2682486 RepID=UPI0012E18C7D|nr:hypothetical protein [Paenibacillus sp. NEAU-GSW1]MUT68770.1 hypothetical protein [Paenibacillus sp. NEAU-GSW1]
MLKQRMVKLFLSFSIVSAALALPAANAYVALGGKYASGTISYSYLGLTANYSQAMANGIAAWNDADTDVSFVYQSDSTKANIIFRQDTYGANIGWYARTQNKPVHTSGTYTKTDIDFNSSAMDGLSVTGRKGTSGHELGHAIGLDHVSQSTQIMSVSGIRQVSVPGSDDKAGANALY